MLINPLVGERNASLGLFALFASIHLDFLPVAVCIAVGMVSLSSLDLDLPTIFHSVHDLWVWAGAYSGFGSGTDAHCQSID